MGGGPAARTRVLRIECADEKGLIHKVTAVLFKKGLNIVRNDEFVDAAEKRFFMRTEFLGTAPDSSLRKGLKSLLPRGAKIELVPRRRKTLVILATREHHCLGELLLRQAYGELDADVLGVVSNQPSLAGLAARFRVPYRCVSHGGKSREAHEAEILKVLGRWKPDYLVLAKYMRILSPEFVARYKNRIVNIHHSFLPAFAGANPYQQAYDRGVKIIGATAHFVTEELDRGPIIAQGLVPVDHSHGVSDMTQAGRDVEKIVLAKAIRLAFEDRIFVSDNKTIIFD